MKHPRTRCKLCHINQAGQTTTCKETCIKFIKYAESRLWANIYEIYWDFCSAKIISLQKKKTAVGTITVAITDSSDVRCLDLYLVNIFTKSTKAEMYRYYVQAGTLLFICYWWIFKFIMKIDMKRYFLVHAISLSSITQQFSKWAVFIWKGNSFKSR